MSALTCEICGVKVTSWSAKNKADTWHCESCFGSEKAAKYIKNKSQQRFSDLTEKMLSEKKNSNPMLPKIFFFLAVIAVLGGIGICTSLWPSDPGVGREWKTAAYLPAITWLMIGIVQCAIYAAIGQALIYLHAISMNTEKSNESNHMQL